MASKKNMGDSVRIDQGSDMCSSVRKVDQGGSEMWAEFYCCVCLKEKPPRNVYAEKHCTYCGTNLCNGCRTQHDRFFQGHIRYLQDKLQPPKPKPMLPTQQCSQHFGKVIDQFCEEHNIACCSACMLEDHGSCTGKIAYIPNIAQGFKDNQEVKDLESEVKDLQSRLQTQRTRKQTNLQQLKKDQDELLKEIRALKKKMNEELDKMEKVLLKETEDRFKEKLKTVSKYISEIDNSLAQIANRLKHLQDAKNDNESELFVACKLWQHELKEGSENAETLPFERSLKLNKYPFVKAIEEGRQQLARLQESTVVRSTIEDTDISVEVENDQMRADITAMCELGKDLVVFADYNNKRLKTLNMESLEVSTLIDLQDNPFGVCTVDDTSVAVTLINKKRVQFVAVGGKSATVGSGFSVIDRCRGVAYSNGLVYVCCGGSPNREDEGPGCVQVFKRHGGLLRCYYGGIVCASLIAVDNDVLGPFMMFFDEDKGVQLMNMNGEVSHNYAVSNGYNVPFCLLGNDSLCIGECSSGNIYVRSLDTRFHDRNRDVIATVGEMQALYYDERRSRLVVTFGENNIVKVLSLNLEA